MHTHRARWLAGRTNSWFFRTPYFSSASSSSTSPRASAFSSLSSLPARVRPLESGGHLFADLTYDNNNLRIASTRPVRPTSPFLSSFHTSSDALQKARLSVYFQREASRRLTSGLKDSLPSLPPSFRPEGRAQDLTLVLKHLRLVSLGNHDWSTRPLCCADKSCAVHEPLHELRSRAPRVLHELRSGENRALKTSPRRQRSRPGTDLVCVCVCVCVLSKTKTKIQIL